MKALKLILTVILVSFSQLIFGQQTSSPWDKWNYLIGEWVGEGNGQP